MKKIIIILFILISSLIFAQETQKPTPPEICVRMIYCNQDGSVCIVCIDGFTWLVVGYNAYQMREMKEGKEVLKSCKCEENAI